MRTSDAGRRHIIAFEDLRTVAYLCPAGKWTIGVGHTYDAGPPAVRPGMTITRDEALAIFDRDLLKFESAVERNVKVSLSQGQFDALVSFVFNLGEGNFRKSTLLRKLNRGQYDAVPAELMKWTKATVNGQKRDLPGLVRRRRAEAALWRELSDVAAPGEDARVEPAPPPPGKTIVQSKEANAAVATAATGALTAITDAIPALQGAAGLVQGLADALGRPAVIAGIVIVALSAAIWYWRKERLEVEV